MDDEAFETGSAIAVVPVTGGEPVYLTDFDSFAYYPDWNRLNDQIVFSTETRSAARDYDETSGTWHLLCAPRLPPCQWGPRSRAFDERVEGSATLEPALDARWRRDYSRI